MKQYARKHYLDQLIQKKDNGRIKVITGIRRSGKSYLLFTLYRQYLLDSGINEDQIVGLALDEIDNAKYRNPFELNKVVRERMPDPNRRCYVFVDEIQFVSEVPKQTVVFCTSVRHSEELSELFREHGIEARSVSGKTQPQERKRILEKYEKGEIPILCACDLLNEGWDSPHTQVLFMSRPTMSKTIYMRQLGRGMRTCEGKDFLMVFDFVDNANIFNCPYSLHRLFNTGDYHPGGLVLGPKRGIHWDNELFQKGEKPEALIDYPVHTLDYEVVDLFNWQEKAKGMISQMELVRCVSAQSETIDRYIKEGKIVPDMEVPISEHRSFRYFNRERPAEYAKQFGWKLITDTNRKEQFLQMAREMTMSYSYKPVFILALLDQLNRDGEAALSGIVDSFTEFYESRIRLGKIPEKKPCIFTKGGYTQKDVERLILNMPFKRFEDMGFISHSKYLGTVKLDRSIVHRLTDEDRQNLKTDCEKALQRYYGELL